MTPTTVTVLMAVIFVAIVAWDIYLVKDKVPDNTISARMRAMPALRLLVSFGFGLLTGHWWW